MATGRSPTLQASATRTAATETARSSMRAPASDRCVNWSRYPVQACTSSSSSGRSNLGSIRATVSRSATRLGGSGSASNRSRLRCSPPTSSSSEWLDSRREATPRYEASNLAPRSSRSGPGSSLRQSALSTRRAWPAPRPLR